jgi:hypothetical protein
MAILHFIDNEISNMLQAVYQQQMVGNPSDQGAMRRISWQELLTRAERRAISQITVQCPSLTDAQR